MKRTDSINVIQLDKEEGVLEKIEKDCLMSIPRADLCWVSA